MNSDQIINDNLSQVLDLESGVGEDFLQEPTIQTDTLIQVEVPQVRFKTSEGKLNLILPPEIEIIGDDGSTHISLTWNDLLEQLQQKIIAQADTLGSESLIYLQAGDRLLDVRQIQELSEVLQTQGLILYSVSTFRRQTAIAAVTAGLSVEQSTKSAILSNSEKSVTPQDDPLYVKMTVRSGVEIRHNGSIIIFGDVNAGGEIIATGDILVWGKLKGIAHAGAKGNAQAVIMALHLEATQIRIADFVARVDTPTTNFSPEIAHVSRKGMPSICITPAASFSSR
jgi:septum site-determining protein MinC